MAAARKTNPGHLACAHSALNSVHLTWDKSSKHPPSFSILAVQLCMGRAWEYGYTVLAQTFQSLMKISSLIVPAWRTDTRPQYSQKCDAWAPHHNILGNVTHGHQTTISLETWHMGTRPQYPWKRDALLHFRPGAFSKNVAKLFSKFKLATDEFMEQPTEQPLNVCCSQSLKEPSADPQSSLSRTKLQTSE